MKQIFYRELAKYYDLVYHKKDYKKESGKLLKLISKYKKSKGNDLLEVACGTGKYLEHFKKYFRCVGCDLNKEMLKLARKRIKKVLLKKCDMINFDLKKKFDVILCLFSSIGYVKTYANLKKAILNFARHLKPAGVVIIEPWFYGKALKPGKINLAWYDGKDVKLARACFTDVKGNLSYLKCQLLIVEKGKGIKHFVDEHEMGNFAPVKFLKFMREAGLKAKHVKGLRKGKELYIGVKKQNF